VTSANHARSERPSAGRASSSPTTRPPIDRSRSGLASAPVQLGSDQSHGQDTLTTETVEKLAGRIVELIGNRLVEAVVDAITDARDLPTVRLVDAATIAERFGVERRFVYDHQRELGAVRLGHGPKARLRFDPRHVEAVLGQHQEIPTSWRDRRRRRRSSAGPHVELLPIKGAK
jgi:hypothetical protein